MSIFNPLVDFKVYDRVAVHRQECSWNTTIVKFSTYLHFTFQLTYVTADFNNAPPAEAETPSNVEAVEYTGAQFAQAWGCKQSVQGTHTYTLIAGMLKMVKAAKSVVSAKVVII